MDNICQIQLNSKNNCAMPIRAFRQLTTVSSILIQFKDPIIVGMSKFDTTDAKYDPA